MKLIKPAVSLIFETNPYKRIEQIGRICYKSENLISDNSAVPFVCMLAEHHHFAMLEHTRITFEVLGAPQIPAEILNMPGVGYTYKFAEDGEIIQYITLSLSHIYKHIYLSEATKSGVIHEWMTAFGVSFKQRYSPTAESEKGRRFYTIDNIPVRIAVITDLAAEIVNYDLHDHEVHSYYSMHFVCDRGVSHELVRHRCAVAQESTRYCNYAKDKFGNGITYVEPADWDEWGDDAKATFLSVLTASEAAYLQMIGNYEFTPQQARAVLPNALKTEVVLTMPVWQWKHFFNMRSIGTTGKPHPDMKVVADKAYELFKSIESLDDKIQ